VLIRLPGTWNACLPDIASAAHWFCNMDAECEGVCFTGYFSFEHISKMLQQAFSNMYCPKFNR
jgi:hypothetical protein